jgi:hypothetical protein
MRRNSFERHFCSRRNFKLPILQNEEKMIVSITKEEYQMHAESYDGICLSCGEFSCGGVEPDAENYECDDCGESRVYGTEQALLIGAITICDS